MMNFINLKKLKFTTSDLNRFLYQIRKKDNIMDIYRYYCRLINENIDTPPDNLYI